MKNMTNERLPGEGSATRPSSQPPGEDASSVRQPGQRPKPPTPTAVLDKDRGAESQAGIGDQGALQSLTKPDIETDTPKDVDRKPGVGEGQFRRDLNNPIRNLQ